jgi:hypothetical protein
MISHFRSEEEKEAILMNFLKNQSIIKVYRVGTTYAYYSLKG